VKFQTFITEEFLSEKNEVYEYVNNGKIVKENMFDMFKRLEFTKNQFSELSDYCKKKNILFLSTPCDIESMNMLLNIGMPALKISSDDLINIWFFEAAAKAGVPIIFSTGMADENEIEIAVEILKKNRCRDAIALHCTSVYPTPENEVNLNRMKHISKRFGVLTGFSDHTCGISAAAGSAFMGAVIIEKHFTISRKLPGPDHAFSMVPEELRTLKIKISEAEILKGEGKIKPSMSEETVRKKFRRSIVASRNLKSGDKIKTSDICFKRPGAGLQPYLYKKIIGRTLKRNITPNSYILFSDLK